MATPAGMESEDDYSDDDDFEAVYKTRYRKSALEIKKEDAEALNNEAGSWLKEMARNVNSSSGCATREWLEALEEKWSGQYRQVSAVLREAFSSSKSSPPYSTVLYLVSHCRDFKLGKTNSLSYCIACEFRDWMSRQECPENPSEALQLQALAVAIEHHLVLVKPLFDAFSMNNGCCGFLKSYIDRYLLERKLYKEMAIVVKALKLEDLYDIEEISLPLIFQDKVNVVENYVLKNEKQQRALVHMLDQLCDPEMNLNGKALSLGVPNVKYEKMDRKPLAKLAKRLMKLYNVHQKDCINIYTDMCLQDMRYTVYQRYNAGLFQDNGVWQDKILMNVAWSEYLQRQLVETLVDHLDMLEAAKWARQFGLERSTLPYQILDHFDQLGGQSLDDCWVDESQENWGGEVIPEERFHTLSLTMNKITIVDTREEFIAFVNKICKPGTVAGIDSEWRPILGPDMDNQVALLQVATLDHAYLVDTMALHWEDVDDVWIDLGRRFFEATNVRKIGFSIQGDLLKLGKMFPVLKPSLIAITEVLDLQLAHEQISKLGLQLCPSAQPKSENIRGLSELVRNVFGKPLDKGSQTSDWQRRPLRQAQIKYAALDAYVLVELYESLRKVPAAVATLELSFFSCAQFREVSRLDRKRDAVRQVKAISLENVPSEFPETPVGSFSVVVDNMLKGLGRQLRCCGVDTLMVENCESHSLAGRIGRRDNRVILTSGTPFHTLRSLVGEGRCFNVPNATAHEQTIIVLKHFNVKVTKRDIFSRCQACNGDRYLHVDPKQMRLAWTQMKNLESTGIAPKVQVNFSGCPPSQPGEFDEIDVEHVCTLGGIRLQLADIPQEILSKVKVFYVCCRCGKAFWEGTHFSRICDAFSYVLSDHHSGRVDIFKETEQQLGL